MFEKSSKLIQKSKSSGATTQVHPARLDSKARVFEVEIAGVPLRLKSSLSEGMVSEIVRLVDSQIKAAMPLSKTGSVQNAAILASLNIAEAFLSLRNLASAEFQNLEAGALKIADELEIARPKIGTAVSQRN